MNQHCGLVLEETEKPFESSLRPRSTDVDHFEALIAQQTPRAKIAVQAGVDRWSALVRAHEHGHPLQTSDVSRMAQEEREGGPRPVVYADDDGASKLPHVFLIRRAQVCHQARCQLG